MSMIRYVQNLLNNGRAYNSIMQLTRIEHHHLIATTIHEHISLYDNYQHERDALNVECRDSGFLFGHVLLTSRQKTVSLGIFEESHADDIAFRNWRTKLADYFNIMVPASGKLLPYGRRIRFTREDEVCTIDVLAFHR